LVCFLRPIVKPTIMKMSALKILLCASALLFTFTVNASASTVSKNDPAACYSFNGNQKKHSARQKKHQKKNKRNRAARSKRDNASQHCDAY
jgi:hypothetical protein